MVKKPSKHQKSNQTSEDLHWKVLDPAHLVLCSLTIHESHNRNASIG